MANLIPATSPVEVKGPNISQIEKDAANLLSIAHELAARSDSLRNKLTGGGRISPPTPGESPAPSGSLNRIADTIINLRNALGLVGQDLTELEKVS